ncbi:hypothetical protein BYT27DRAFT_7257754 [Phlegmacium glaucopus]|nr:hypothetical protein BYT27DRAFT_7257754 [Phlegmacium glaucopus]
MVKGTKAMPDPGSRRAPDYDLDYPDELEEFLEDFEELAWKYELTSREMSKIVVKYVDRKTKTAWKRLEGYDESYKLLKKKIIKMYHKNKRESKKRRKSKRVETSDEDSDSDSEVLSSEEGSEWEEEQRSIIDKVGELVGQLTLLWASDTLYAPTFAKLHRIAPTVAEYLPLPAGWNYTQPSAMLPSLSFPPALVTRRFESSDKSSAEISHESSDDELSEGSDWEQDEMLRNETEEVRRKEHKEEER